ncbi:hypothetical protein BD324DRAFT_413754 [Kockovaella imperatae]|uniref:Uncharacterized protein n=1 Tax=Kockovaella imperatae TaxID=4999 RepID=A0A1Y1UIV9_9TREE|nr:hypothetical protein BD324DRAFT_413754 [Kockovaella imperatae]ORX38003.1 hypothetical protein BD324DRAFT_413754 [Kockovaella imperatae]
MPTESSADPTTSTSPNGTINFPPAGPTRTRSQPLVPLADGLPPSSTRSPASPSPVSPSPVSSAHLASTSSRHRAHTVSVSFRPPGAPRRGSARATGTFPRDTTSSSATSGGLLSGLTKEFGTGSKSVSEDIDPSPSLPSPRVETPEDRRTGTASERRRRSSSGIDGKRRRSASSARRGVLDSIRQSLEGGRGDERAGTPASVEIEREDGGEPEELHDEVVGVLDVIDDEVATVNHLQNMSNGLIFPNLPGLWSRRPEVILPDQTDNVPSSSTAEEGKAGAGSRRSTRRHRGSTVSKLFPPSASGFRRIPEAPSSPTDPSTTTSKTGRPVHSSLTTDEDDNEEETRSGLTSELNQQMKRIEEEVKSDHLLDAHVKHVLISSSKRDKLRRFGKGLWTFLKTPMGAFTAIYGFLVAFWGAGIVLFLLGWIPTSSKYVQDLWVERCSQIENGLFTLTGIGLVPWRVIDTYRMAKIWHLRVETHKRRKAQGLPPIDDPDDLPDPKEAKDYVSVLSDKEQEELQYQQVKFSKSQTWYRPHATATHTAFPIKWALWNTILMDGNSFFQALLCGCMWGLNWHIRPPWTTGTLIPCSFLCGIGAAVLIWQG